MALLKEKKEEIIKKFRRGNADTGSSEVQIALLTARINELTTHFNTHAKDVHSRRGLLTLVSRRRSLLDYLKRTNAKKYTEIIGELGIRK
jgi:small subunit ribosomal protein S15